ncbi:MAG TPA: hypothetical protein GX506_00150 [Firmicutes bacterium]|nr:hypothetical protein [Bacillota bacterium]
MCDAAAKGATGETRPRLIVVKSPKGVEGYIPLEGARVTAGGVVDITKQDGSFKLFPLSPGYYTVSISHERYMPLTIPNVYVYSGKGTDVGSPNLGVFYYLFVGISDYFPPGPSQPPDYPIGDLNFADDDAELLHESLYLTNHYAGVVVQKLTNADATKARIEAAIKSIVGSMSDQDYFLMTFSGHGGNLYFVDNPPPGDPPYDFIVPHDFTGRTEELILDYELKEWVRSRNKNKVFIFDSCYSGGMYRFPPSLAAKGARPGFSSLARNLNQEGYIVITASSDTEPSFEDRRWGDGHGVFTWYFCEGIRSREADDDGDGIITAREAYEYAAPKVILDTGGQQHPQFYYRGRADVPIYRIPPVTWAKGGKGR